MLARLNNPNEQTPARGGVSALGFAPASEAATASSKNAVAIHSSEPGSPVEPQNCKKLRKKGIKSGESSTVSGTADEDSEAVAPRLIVPVPRRFA